MNITILEFDELESTNAEAIIQARRGAAEGVCVVARNQTKGRGRHGRQWFSSRDSGLYLSVVLRPKIAIRFFPIITLMSAVAVYDTLNEFPSLKPDIKWSNDILVRGRKISGILAETIDTNLGTAVILGIGINFISKDFEGALRNTATSIEEETGAIQRPSELLQSLIKFIGYYYDILQSENGTRQIQKAWEKRSSYYAGKRVVATSGFEKIEGVTCGIDRAGGLKIKIDSGEIKTIISGDIETLRESSSS